MSRFSNYTVVYDISSNRERRKVAETLTGFGFRIQKSVFECKMRNQDKQKLQKKLIALNIKTGFIKTYRLEYQMKNSVIGEGVPVDVDKDAAFIV